MFTKLTESMITEVKEGRMTKWHQIENTNKVTEMTKREKSGAEKYSN